MNSCAFLPNHPLERFPHRPAGRILGSRDILSHEATFLSPGYHPGSLVFFYTPFDPSSQPPFSAPTAQAVLVQILTSDAPSITSMRRTVPPNVGHALARALEKLPADRFHERG